MGYKRDDVEAGTDDSISFFLPLKCDQCPLLKAYNKEQERQGGETIRPVEMGRVIKAAKSYIEKAKKKSAEA